MTNKEIQNAYVGDTQVAKICLGTDIVWPTIVYSAIPLTFEILSAGTITWERYAGGSTNSKTIQYKKNDGEWTSITSNTGSSAPSISVVPGDIVVFKGNNNSYCSGPGYNLFGGSATFKAYGNILSLIYGDNYQTETELPSGNTVNTLHNFDSLFWKNSGITDTSNIIMPQNTKNTCYHKMFEDCINLEKAPALPAATLEPYAYQYMFANCPKLVYVKCLATNISASSCTSNWLSSVSPTGTFVKHPNATWERTVNGIPAGWTVEDADI
jgi:hypothetical protein